MLRKRVRSMCSFDFSADYSCCDEMFQSIFITSICDIFKLYFVCGKVPKTKGIFPNLICFSLDNVIRQLSFIEFSGFVSISTATVIDCYCQKYSFW